MDGEAPRIRVREASLADAEPIARLQAGNGLGEIDPAAWRSQWENHPFAPEFRDLPIGWVLESAGEGVVGSLGSIHVLYDFGGRQVRAAATSGWVVTPECRTHSLKLITSFFRQKGVDLWLNGSANEVASRLMTTMNVPRIPAPDYAGPWFWAIHPRSFAKAALVRKGIKGAGAWSYPAAIGMHARDILTRSGRGRPRSLTKFTGFDGRFDEFWQALCSGPPRLRAVRTRAALQWRFRQTGTILAAERAGSLRGYAVILPRQGSTPGMKVHDIADLQVLEDDPAVIRDLLLGCLQAAREADADAVKFMSCAPAKRAAAAALRPYTQRLPFWQMYFRAAQPDLAATLQAPEAWDFSLFDAF